tara:strand:- start:4166 stop:4618 length:453 start_codon:yes stop_codon:yes gene_type:complete
VIGAEVLTTVFLMQYSWLITTTASLYVDTCGHDLRADLCRLNPTDCACRKAIRPIGAYIGDICHNITMSEVGNLPNRANSAGKKTSPWMDRFVLFACIFGAWEISNEVISAMEPQLGWWANPVAVIILGLATLYISSQIVLIFEKILKIR